MKQLIIIVLMCVLAACSGIREKELVPVDKPFPACPMPPPVPVYDSWVDKLTEADINDPGKVGQAYKHDMIYLRQRILMDQNILDQYSKTAQQYDQTKKQIDKAYEKLNK